jgi:hypothetical protein
MNFGFSNFDFSNFGGGSNGGASTGWGRNCGWGNFGGFNFNGRNTATLPNFNTQPINYNGGNFGGLPRNPFQYDKFGYNTNTFGINGLQRGIESVDKIVNSPVRYRTALWRGYANNAINDLTSSNFTNWPRLTYGIG